jgi:hypothetical protein
MKRRIVLSAAFAAFFLAGALLTRHQPFRAPRVVHAQTGCDATSLNGAYGYTYTGFYFDQFGNTNFLSVSGRFVADGQGNLTGKESDSFSGQVLRGDPYTGTYTIDSDCTGTLSTSSQAVGSAAYDFVLVNNGAEIQLVETDGGTNITGVGKKQSIPVPAATQ